MTTAVAEHEVTETHDDGTGPLFEIVNGLKVEKPMSLRSQRVGGLVYRHLDNYVAESGVGGFAVPEPFIICFDWMPDTRRRPDVAYWRGEQYPDGIPERGDAQVAPAIAVEVVSFNDNAEALAEKIAEYFRAGVELVWTVSPRDTNRPCRAARRHVPRLPPRRQHHCRAGVAGLLRDGVRVFPSRRRLTRFARLW